MSKRINEVLLHFRNHRIEPDGSAVLRNNGGYTVLVRKDGPDYHVAVARCSKKDNFNKHVGKAIVEGRMVCDRRLVRSILDKDGAIQELWHYNERAHETYSREFLERLINKLV